MNQDFERSLARSVRIASIGLLLIGIGVITWGVSTMLSGLLFYRHSFTGPFGSTSYTVSTVEGAPPEPDFMIDSNSNFSIRVDTNSPAWKERMQKDSYTPPIHLDDDKQE